LLVVTKRSKPTGRLNSQSLSPGMIIGFTFLTLEPIHWSLTP
jgi:hypothetical protein